MTVPALSQALRDPDAVVRRNAAEALSAFGPAAKTAIPQLRLAVNDEDEDVSQAATEALSKIDRAR
jgi:HEAT repeat protein